MYLNRWKNFIIGFLIFLAIYQTNNLWFDVYSKKSTHNEVAMQNDTLYLTSDILINTGDNKFIRKTNNISNSEYKRLFDESIYLAIKKGKFDYIQKYNMDNILNNKCIIYTYDFDINTKTMQKIFNIKSNYFSKLDSFDNIIILPTSDNKYDIKIIFLSSATLNAYEVRYKKETVKKNILDTIEEFKALENKEIYYVSSQDGYEQYFTKNQFLPKAKIDTLYIENIEAYNPLEKGGGVLLSESEKYVDVFFENPAIKSSSFINNTYTYNDENIIVKYYPNGILEYVEYKSVLDNNKKESDYKIAIDFLKKDTNIKNEYYLTGYKQEDNKTIFYFDYKLNNFPILLSNEIKQKTDMSSIIEVVVENGRVSKYKRLIYNFEVNRNYTLLKNRFENIISDKKNIDKMYLGYVFEKTLQSMDIKWILEKGNNISIQDTR